jgi:esterase FrsA
VSDVNGAAVSGRPKTLPEAKEWMRSRLKSRTHPMNALSAAEGEAWIAGVPGLDGESWGTYWGGLGDRAAEDARAAERAGDSARAMSLYQKASGLYFMGRFPCPNHPAKQRCAAAEREAYLAASRHWKEPIRKVSVPFAGREGEGSEVILLVRRPANVARPPVVLMWGGVDACKEQMTAASDALLARGVATVAMDNAGTGESPVRGVQDAERQFLAAMDWVAAQADLAGARVGLLGRSFGGYWATKLAHLVPERIAGAVNWGGGAHHMFQPEWVQASRHPDSYLMELVETRRLMLGAADDAEYVAFFQRLSLLDQALLDQPCAPLLLVNGKEDRQCPVADIHLLLEHGSPKSVRLFPGGHMGLTPQTLPTIVEWLAKQVSGEGVRA